MGDWVLYFFIVLMGAGKEQEKNDKKNSQ